jgi:uncharacterized Zn-binding protein involved in type VI secretion
MKRAKIPETTKCLSSVLLFVFLGMLPQMILSDSGKPAARLGDTTAHGGQITVGCATVLIGGMPAARVGDMHTCPMVDAGYVPHVGGPILMGSPTVIIGGMPAARMGDLAACAGPPDSIVMGCPTVLIGTGRAGAPKKYSEDYIKARYDKSLVTTQKKSIKK